MGGRILKIKYPNGRMSVDVDTFFPASKVRVRKLLKIMQMDDDADRVKQELLGMLDARVEDPRATLINEQTDYIMRKLKYKEAIRQAESLNRTIDAMLAEGAAPGVIREARRQRTAARKDMREAGIDFRGIARSLERHRRECVALLEDIKVIEDGKESE